jgi:hypothetical protein
LSTLDPGWKKNLIRDNHPRSATLQETVELNEMANVELNSKDETSMLAPK